MVKTQERGMPCDPLSGVLLPLAYAEEEKLAQEGKLVHSIS